MALTRKVAANYAKAIRFRKDGSDRTGCGDDRHILAGPVGLDNADQLRYRSLLNFAWDWDDVKKIVKVELVLKVEDDSTHFPMGAKAKIRVTRNTGTWSEGTSAENVWTSGEYQKPAYVGAVDKELTINSSTGVPQDDVWLYIDVTALLKDVVPKGVKMPDGTSGLGGVNHGFQLRVPLENTNNQRAIFHSFHATDPLNRPYIWITYDPINQAPTAPTLLGPATTNNTFADKFEGQHNDPDGDSLAAREIVVYPAGSGTKAWSLSATLQTAGSDETVSGRFSVPLSLAAASLKLQTNYEWIARTRDPDGLWGPYSGRRALRITSSAPTVVATPYTSRATMTGALFGGTYSDPEGNALSLFHIQMRRISAHTDAAFADPTEYVWDTGETKPSSLEISQKRVARDYGGEPLNAGSYTYRFRAQDSTGIWSAWAYDDFALTADFDPDPGNTDLTTQIARNAPVRIALYAMGTLRGRGALIGYLDDPMDLGHSAYMNNGGELYFSLPALHPYCPSIEAHRTHYAVEQYYGDRYRELFQGIITDFDADADEVVFYGTDYLGLLQTSVDERYNPAKIEETAPTGSKYVDKTIDFIIRDQLTYHKNLANSPTGFIGIGTMTALAERVTIYSTYSEALPFIGGLIASHKQGTGREARLYVKPNATYTSWAWTLTDNWGKDRPNIRLEYGGLLNDFRVVALGDFGTRVLAVGQKRGEVKVYRAVGTGGLNETQWGRRAKTRFYQDITDQNDLNRRAKEDAMVLSKIGKRMALAIRSDMLSPFDGWDVGDNIIIDIERGVVDTDQYGSGGYWTIIGVEWRYYPDGHSDMVLTVLPKKTSTPPDPDLIPSINPGVPRHWQVGYGVPKKFGEVPYNTPTLLSINPLALGPQERMLSAAPAPADHVPGSYSIGTRFMVNVAGQITHLRYWHDSNCSTDDHILSLWTDAGAKVATATDSPARTFLGWRDVILPTPYPVAAGEVYRVSAALSSFVYATPMPASLAPSLSILHGCYVAGGDAFPTTIETTNFFGDVVYQTGAPDPIPSDVEPVTSQFYEDLNTGCVYEFTSQSEDPEVDDYVLVSCPEAGGGGSVGLPLGGWLWEETRGIPPSGHMSLVGEPPLMPDGGVRGDIIIDDQTGEPLYPDT